MTDKLEANDVAVFLLTEDSFDAAQVTGELQLLFNHAAAQDHFGASVSWLRRLPPCKVSSRGRVFSKAPTYLQSHYTPRMGSCTWRIYQGFGEDV